MPADLRRVVATYRDALRAHQEELNRLNVYPVPDGDTGTNMALTLESVVGELDGADAGADADRGMRAVCAAISHGSLMGARGQLGRDPQPDPPRARRHVRAARGRSRRTDVVAGLRRAADAAYEAVLRPVEGTILTVVRMAAESVERGARRRRDHARRPARAGGRGGPRRGRAHARAAAGAARRGRGRRRRPRVRAAAAVVPVRGVGRAGAAARGRGDARARSRRTCTATTSPACATR